MTKAKNPKEEIETINKEGIKKKKAIDLKKAFFRVFQI